MARRDEFGRVHLQFSTVLASGINNIAHGLSDIYAEIDDYSAFVVGADGKIIKDNNPYSINGSWMIVSVDATNFVIDVHVKSFNIIGETLKIYLIKRPNT
jgi:hypothetical protein